MDAYLFIYVIDKFSLINVQGCQIVVYAGWVERAVVNPAEMMKENKFEDIINYLLGKPQKVLFLVARPL